MGPASPPDDRFDTIIKQNEQMRQMLTDIMAGMNKSKPVEVEMTEVAPEVSPHDAQVLAILQENEMLRQENAHLREAVVALETRLSSWRLNKLNLAVI
ncbi:hypothetical protein BC829DRAFT_182368 [Chytridium lagenaria]|nr:hypothetical protein BC829DRAFT_182368 [Chytridium lagenaria]